MSTKLITYPGSPTGTPVTAILITGSSPEHHRNSRPTVFYEIEAIQTRASTITPLLKKILDFRPSPHWGINE